LRFLFVQEARIAPKSKPKTAAKAKPASKKTTALKPAPKEGKTKPPSRGSAAMLETVLKSLDQDKGVDILSIDLAGKTAIADYMVIVTGTSSRHITSMAEKLRDRLAKDGVKARVEGKSTADWVILDAGDVIVHLFRQEVRSFYNLEKLWSADFETSDYTVYKSV
jgi:ribosome-associated protein